MMKHVLSLCLLLSIPGAYLFAQEVVADVATAQEPEVAATESPAQAATTQGAEDMEAAAKQRATELLNSYNPQLFAVAEKMVANVEAYQDLITRVQETFPRFTMGYVFTVDASDLQAPKVNSEVLCTFKHAQASEQKDIYKMDELAVLKDFGMSKLEISLLKDFLKAAQVNFDRQIASSIVQHEELAHLVTESKLSLNQWINLANAEASVAAPAQTEATVEAAAPTTETPAAPAEVAAPADADKTQHEEVHAEA